MKKIENCINCGLCKDICPTKAISYQYKNGFKTAVIDKEKCIKCKSCIKICPLNKNYEQIELQEISVLRLKDEKKINDSSSGGVFGEIARFYIKKNFIIYGATFNQDNKVTHKRVASINEINSLMKSKYVQSDLNNVFNDVNKDLNDNKKVIFSGTPCQIAALKAYLKKDYLNLITIDIICHGTPSPKIWDNYMKYIEAKEKSKIENIDFRYNNQKEITKNFLIKLQNKKNIEMSLYESNYGGAFLNNIILNNSCYNCKFKNSKNLSDITLGDAHGYKNEKYKNKFSLVIMNTKKGKDIIKSIENKFNVYKDFETEDLVKYNYPIIYPPLKHPNSKYILANYNKYEKKHILPNYQENQIDYDKKNVGILNFYYENYNFGANLVAYSLSEIIKNMGYNPYIINFNPFPPIDTFEQFKTIEFVKFREKYLNLTREYKNSNELYETNEYINAFVVGSDQVWRKAITHNNFTTYFLDFAKWSKKCLSYGASFGNDLFEGNSIEKKECGILLKKFSSISVREEDAKKIVKELSKMESTQVLDPTLLLTKDNYNELLEKENQNEIEEKYVAVYCLFEQDETFENEIKRLFKDTKIIDIKQKEEKIPLLKKSFMQYRSIYEWINLIKNAEFVITDSYHGMLFSILYNKNFICLGKNSKAKSRFDTISNLFAGNIKTRIVETIQEIKKIDDLIELDYLEINKKIEENRKKSIDFLEKALQNNTRKDNIDVIDDYQTILNCLKKKIEKQDCELENLKTEKENITIENENITADLKDVFQKYVNISYKYDELSNKKIEMSNQIDELTLKNKESNHQIEELNILCKNQDNIINDMINSKSWKITKPLRKLREKVCIKDGKK